MSGPGPCRPRRPSLDSGRFGHSLSPRHLLGCTASPASCGDPGAAPTRYLPSPSAPGTPGAEAAMGGAARAGETCLRFSKLCFHQSAARVRRRSPPIREENAPIAPSIGLERCQSAGLGRTGKEALETRSRATSGSVLPPPHPHPAADRTSSGNGRSARAQVQSGAGGTTRPGMYCEGSRGALREGGGL